MQTGFFKVSSIIMIAGGVISALLSVLAFSDTGILEASVNGL